MILQIILVIFVLLSFIANIYLYRQLQMCKGNFVDYAAESIELSNKLKGHNVDKMSYSDFKKIYRKADNDLFVKVKKLNDYSPESIITIFQ